LEEVTHLTSCGLGIKVTRSFTDKEVICDYVEKLLSDREGKEKYQQSPENTTGLMFEFNNKETTMRCDATEKELQADRLQVSCERTYACYILPLGSVCLRLCNG